MQTTEAQQPTGGAPAVKQFKLGHRVWLDVLRGLAVSLVVAHHFFLIPNGSFGVDIFFVLSGFLITAILCEEFTRTETISLKRFYIRRMLRLLPLLYTLIIGYVLITWIFNPLHDRSKGFLEALTVATYTVNLYSLHSIEMGPLGFTWSLCVEEHFYLVWPILLFAALRMRVPRAVILLSVFAAILGVVMWRSHVYDQFLAQHAGSWKDWFRVYSGTDTRADGLLVGCVLGLLASWNCLPQSKAGVFTLKLVGIAASIVIVYSVFYVSFFHPLLMRGLYTAFAALVALGMAWMLVSPPKFVNQNSLGVRIFSGLGKVSYGLYIIHLPMTDLYSRIRGWEDNKQLHYGWSHPLSTAVPIIASVLAAWACFYLIERPALRLKKRFEGPTTFSIESTASSDSSTSVPNQQHIDHGAKRAA